MASAARGTVWFVTGCSRGFGRVWVQAALNRGDMVAATARDTDALADFTERYPDTFLSVKLDVTDRAAVFSAVERAHARFGRLDVIIGNAGYGLFGAVEETSEAAARQQIEVNFFGNLWLLQAVAPVLRLQGGGHVLLNTSFGGLISFATAGIYGASKYALEGLGESFALEMQDFGTKVTLVEPAAYSTDFNGSSADQAPPIPDYDSARDRTAQVFQKMPPGDPQHTADAILTIVDMDQPPLRVMLGEHVLPLVLDQYEDRTDEWKKYASVAKGAQ